MKSILILIMAVTGCFNQQKYPYAKLKCEYPSNVYLPKDVELSYITKDNVTRYLTLSKFAICDVLPSHDFTYLRCDETDNNKTVIHSYSLNWYECVTRFFHQKE